MILTAALLSTALALQSIPPKTTGARLELSEGGVDFGELEVGDSASETIELTNTGDEPVRVEDVDYTRDDFLAVDDGDCEGAVLLPGESCEFDITFNPDEPGRFRGSVEIETASGDLELTLEGEAVIE
jgi:hypothetical protein